MMGLVKSLAKYCLYEVPAAMFDAPLEKPTPKEQSLIDEFRQSLTEVLF